MGNRPEFYRVAEFIEPLTIYAIIQITIEVVGEKIRMLRIRLLIPKKMFSLLHILWSDNIDKLMIFHKLLNELNADIEFTMEVNDSKSLFLDVVIIKEDNRLSTDVYCKSTDTHRYLHFGSCHPHHTDIPYHLARCIYAIVSDINTCTKDMFNVTQILPTKKQGYDNKIIQNRIEKANTYDPSQFLTTKGQNEENNIDLIPFVHKHNSHNRSIHSIVKHLNTLRKEDQ
jgi:hypothetical protein